MSISYSYANATGETTASTNTIFPAVEAFIQSEQAKSTGCGDWRRNTFGPYSSCGARLKFKPLVEISFGTDLFCAGNGRQSVFTKKQARNIRQLILHCSIYLPPCRHQSQQLKIERLFLRFCSIRTRQYKLNLSAKWPTYSMLMPWNPYW